MSLNTYPLFSSFRDSNPASNFLRFRAQVGGTIAAAHSTNIRPVGVVIPAVLVVRGGRGEYTRR